MGSLPPPVRGDRSKGTVLLGHAGADDIRACVVEAYERRVLSRR
jgi:hypothetical protein